MINRDVVIAVLVTLCLTVTLFSTMRAGGYDPWADIDDSGKIDIIDIANVASQFNTVGNSTKNVKVTNSYYEWGTNNLIIGPGDICYIENSSLGFRTVTFCCNYMTGVREPIPLLFMFYGATVVSPPVQMEGGAAIILSNANSEIQRTYQVVGGRFVVVIYADPTYWTGNEPVTLCVYIYMTT